MFDRIKDWISEPGIVKSPLMGFGGYITAANLRGTLEWVVLVATAFLVVTQCLTWTVRHFICRPRDGRGPCTACNYFGRWLCPGPRKAPDEPKKYKYE